MNEKKRKNVPVIRLWKSVKRFARCSVGLDLSENVQNIACMFFFWLGQVNTNSNIRRNWKEIRTYSSFTDKNVCVLGGLLNYTLLLSSNYSNCPCCKIEEK